MFPFFSWYILTLELVATSCFSAVCTSCVIFVGIVTLNFGLLSGVPGSDLGDWSGEISCSIVTGEEFGE